MTVRKRERSWYYDFTLEGFGRHKKAGFRTKAEAEEAEKRKREELRLGRRRFTLAQAFEMYLSANKMKDRSRDTYRGHWRRDIEPVLGHYYIEEVDTSSLDELKLTLPDHLGPKSVNHRVKLVGTPLKPSPTLPPTGTPNQSGIDSSMGYSRCTRDGTPSSISQPGSAFGVARCTPSRATEFVRCHRS